MNLVINLGILVLIMFVYSFIIFLILFLLLRKDILFQKKVKKMYKNLAVLDRKKWKKEKKKTLLISIIFSFVVSLLYQSIITVFRNPNAFERSENYLFFPLGLISIFSVLLIISYILLDSRNKKKWMKIM